MRLVVQRVVDASVYVEKKRIGYIHYGLLIYVGFTHTDTLEIVKKAVSKILKLRIFDDSHGVMNNNVCDTDGQILLISQFTLYGQTKGQNRPSWIQAAKPDQAKPLYDAMLDLLTHAIHTESGIFGADMQVTYTNDGPVTLTIEMEG